MTITRKNKKATIKMFIAYISLLSFGTIFIILASIVWGQLSLQKDEEKKNGYIFF